MNDIIDQHASLQVADVVLVSTDTRAFGFAKKMAERGWKTVVIELSGGQLNKDLEWPDRLGPFLAWNSLNPAQENTDDEFAAVWLPSGPIQFAGLHMEHSQRHLRLRYQAGEGLSNNWPEALRKSLFSSRLKRREVFLDSRSNTDPGLPWTQSVSKTVQAEQVAFGRREEALKAGVRILDADQVTGVRLSSGHIDRIDFRSRAGEILQERTRSVVWMLSLDESQRADFAAAEVPLESMFRTPQITEPLMGWWRNRFAIKGLTNSRSKALARLPYTPPVIIAVGSIERPWTHDNLLVLDQVEKTTEKNSEMSVFDVWMRIPYWARADHVYRDEQRVFANQLLSDRFPGTETLWVTPSPLGLTAPAVRLPHILYSHDTGSPGAKLQNICFAGPESWQGVGLLGLEEKEDVWLSLLEQMRIQWDPAARVKASRLEQFKFAIRNIGSSRSDGEASP
ncbi:MAG: hypothetical protein J0L82_13335 [Deltaproteobacteria bacterium]|jgi:hypothetical protein|nr:hypothetical protein [Deltaproteobacteria bacterium]